MRETVISTVNLSGGSHSMLPNQCQPYGRQKVSHHKQTNKEVCTNIMINWWLCPSQHPDGLNYWWQVCVLARKSSLQGKIWEDRRVMIQNMTPTTSKKKKEVVAKIWLAQELKFWFIMIMTEFISPPAFWQYNEDNATASKWDLFYIRTNESYNEVGRWQQLVNIRQVGSGKREQKDKNAETTDNWSN